ncbi:hypothetical protein DL546_003091 [Coniochaeta pulveracea]|uniref:Uncharacterized protein n=1 Tax=Coniochaeta pulveracea TaxID=177199 RepID=A0A420YB70_9PEZI|nr:hypothetical protein DL546_003091 [Coniochaeta pulveracea]
MVSLLAMTPAQIRLRISNKTKRVLSRWIQRFKRRREWVGDAHHRFALDYDSDEGHDLRCAGPAKKRFDLEDVEDVPYEEIGPLLKVQVGDG